MASFFEGLPAICLNEQNTEPKEENHQVLKSRFWNSPRPVGRSKFHWEGAKKKTSLRLHKVCYTRRSNSKSNLNKFNPFFFNIFLRNSSALLIFSIVGFIFYFCLLCLSTSVTFLRSFYLKFIARVQKFLSTNDSVSGGHFLFLNYSQPPGKSWICL